MFPHWSNAGALNITLTTQEERLFGATLLILANKQDIASALSIQELKEVNQNALHTQAVFFSGCPTQ
jgi:signal recognition particle receptor subunit beta